MKKILSLALCIIMLFLFTSVAFATGENSSNDFSAEPNGEDFSNDFSEELNGEDFSNDFSEELNGEDFLNDFSEEPNVEDSSNDFSEASNNVTEVPELKDLEDANEATTLQWATKLIYIRKITDVTYRQNYPAYSNKIDGYLEDIATPFLSTWNLKFTHGKWVINTTLPAANCPLDNHLSCCDHKYVCGYTCQNDTSTPNHHKNHYRNWYLLNDAGQDTNNITIGFFGFAPCSASGLSADWLSTVCQPTTWTDNWNRRTLQHEISHLFGCQDGACSTEHPCIMSGGYDDFPDMNQSNIWCANCRNAFDRTAH